ncbi:MAG: hypothetical protein WC647_13820 [Desulfomonilaceae bacterium]
MLKISDRLSPTSEMLALTTSGDTKNILICLIELTGPLNVNQALEAAQRAAAKFPQLTRRIKEVKSRWFHYLVWDADSKLKVPVFFQEIEHFEADRPMLDQLIPVIQSRLERNWDLFQEPPAEFHLIRISPERHIAGWLMHHVAGDAATGTDVGQETLVQYFEIHNRQKSEWAGEYYSFSGSKKRRVTPKKLRIRNYLEDVKQTFENLFRKAYLPVGSGSKHDNSQHHVKRLLTEEETDLLYATTTNHGVSFVDRLVVTASDVIDKWNLKRGVSPGLVTTSMTVNMRGRFSDVDSMNSSSLIFFKSSPSDRANPRSFARKVALTRIKHFRNQTDLKLSKNIEMMIDAFRIFPFQIRKRIISFFINKHQFSIGITVLGTVWPEIQNGKPTTNSAFTRIGDLEAVEIFGVAHKMLSETRALLLLYTFRKRLNLVLTCSGRLFTREECEEFMDMIISKLTASQMFPVH